MLILLLLVPAPARALGVSHLYNLSDFTGTVPYSDVVLHADRRSDEVYAAIGNTVRVFDGSGMAIYDFDVEPRHGSLYAIAVDESGDLLLLTLGGDSGAQGWSILRTDFRGEPTGRIVPGGLPPELASFRPNRMFYRGGRFLLASTADMRALGIDRSGAFQHSYDLASMIGIKVKDRRNHEIAGLDVDRSGHFLFTVPTLFRAFVVSPEGEVKSFGRAGSVPGAFSVLGGIVSDERGNLILADKGRGVIIVYDSNLEFVTEFGGGDEGPNSVVRPTDLAMGRSGKLYVTQGRDRGVAVFQVQPAGGSEPEKGTAGGSSPPPARTPWHRCGMEFASLFDLHLREGKP